MQNQGGAFVRLQGVSKTFYQASSNPFKKRSPVRALQGIDLDIPRGRVTCLLGPNGAGKTTLIKILADLVTQDEGTVTTPGPRARIGLVTPSERSFYWRLSGRENLLFYGRLYGFSGTSLRQRTGQVLEEVGMAEVADQPYQTYSAGMKQKINIARALLGDAELYLLDEPASHLDPLAREDFRGFIEHTLVAQRRATVFLCTHDLEEARALGGRLVVLDKGRIVAQGEREDLLGSPGRLKTLEFVFAGPAPEAWCRDHGVEEAPAGRLTLSFDPLSKAQDEVIADFVRQGGRLLEVHSREADLLGYIRRITQNHA